MLGFGDKKKAKIKFEKEVRSYDENVINLNKKIDWLHYEKERTYYVLKNVETCLNMLKNTPEKMIIELNSAKLEISTFEKEIHEYSNHSFLYSQLAEILIKYNAKDKALYYLLKACFEYLSSYTLDYSTDTLKRFKEYVKRIDFYTNKMKILLEANFDLKNNLTAYYLELTNLYTLHYFTDEEIESLITAFALKNSYGVDSIINRIYKRNKEQGKIKNPYEELDKNLELYRQKKEEKLLLENKNKEKKKGFFNSLMNFILKEK